MPCYVADTVAMIAATQGDVAIAIEETPIMKTEVSNNVHTKGGTIFLILIFIIDKFCLLPNLQPQAEKVRFFLFSQRVY